MEKSKEMQYLFEYHDTLDSPYEAFLYDTSQMAFPIRSHWHYFMELIYMKEGTALIECDGCNYILEPGDLIIFHPCSHCAGSWEDSAHSFSLYTAC